mmetsp:Transcript_3562/g.7868  ORF Transcript_3562/g.7868 Transcript_3562/m.7868 type:complete len:333 (-) Transcript_3562:137-1135(-)
MAFSERRRVLLWVALVLMSVVVSAAGGGKPTEEDVHAQVHAAAVRHAVHRRVEGMATEAAKGVEAEMTSGQAGPTIHGAAQAHSRSSSVAKMPVMPRRPPVCSRPPTMRFCRNVGYDVYRPDIDHTFADLDFDSHAVFLKIVPHMRISEKHFELPAIHTCRNNFRDFLCLRNFPKCCHVGLCNLYGEPEQPLTPADLAKIPDEKQKKRKSSATQVTFLNGSKDKMKVERGRNDTVLVKVADSACLEYVQTFTPLFDCKRTCAEKLSTDCLFMLSQDCEQLCYGVHTETCANKQLYQIATGGDRSPAARPSPSAPLALLLGFVLLAVLPATRR